MLITVMIFDIAFVIIGFMTPLCKNLLCLHHYRTTCSGKTVTSFATKVDTAVA